VIAQEEGIEKDHPLVKRYPGSGVAGGAAAIRVSQFDEFNLVTGPIGKDGEPTKTLHLEGKVFSAPYRNPDDRSVLEIYRNYQQELAKAGFQILFACNDGECGGDTPFGTNPRFYSTHDPNWSNRYLAARLSRPEGDVYVSLLVHAQGRQGGYSDLVVVEVKPMESKELVDATSLSSSLSSSGHVAVYGIYFDTGKADLKPESEATLKEIAKLLEQNPKLKLYVVGHTDNVGTLASNMDLSKRRADAVLKALTTQHGVAAGRLVALGDGPSAPVAANATEGGRAKNRRVELVQQ
jgi:outer membrane protein OmpA-like peptidoglycan-associated protein